MSLTDRFQDAVGRNRIFSFGKGRFNAVLDDAFDISAAVAICPGRQTVQVDTFQIIRPPFPDMDGKDFFPFFLIGQGHIENFIETAFPQQFRRHTGNIICRSHDEGLTVFFLQPRKERPEQTGCHVCCAAAATDSGKGFFKFIDP